MSWILLSGLSHPFLFSLERKAKERDDMPRKRVIDPEFWADEEIGQWSMEARLFYIGLWNFADDEGRLKAHPKLLKAQIFPYDDKINIEELKEKVQKKILWYHLNGQDYGFIKNFKKHQRIDRPSESKIPPPSEEILEKFLNSSTPREEIDEDSTSPRQHVPPKLKEVKLSKDKGSRIDESSSIIKKIIEYFNETTGQKRTLSCKETNDLISGRLNEGRTFDDFKHVIDTKTAQWRNDSKMRAFIRPSTLFRPGNFEDYLNEPYQDPKQKERKTGRMPDKYLIPVPASVLHDVRKIIVNEADQNKLDEKKKTETLSSFFYRLNQTFKDPAKVEAWKGMPQNAESLLRFVRGTA